MAISQQKIQILIEYLTRGATKANEVAKKTNNAIVKQQRRYADATKQGKRMVETTQRNTIAQTGFFQTMRMNQEKLGQFNKQGYKFTNTGGRMANKFRMMTHGARGFRMEMLGIMFFGMAINRAFSGLIKTSMEWMGVMEVLSTALGILFLPIAETLLNWALWFLDVVGKLTEGQKKWIGIFVLIGAVIGSVLMVAGMLALGIGSLILVFGSLGAAIGIIGAIGIGIGLIIGGLILIVRGVYDVFKGKFEGIGLILMGVGAILLLFIGWWALLPIAVGAAIYLIIKYWDSIIGFFKGIVEKIVGFFRWLWNILLGHSIIPDIVNGIINWFMKIPNKIANIAKSVVRAFENMVPSWLLKILRGGMSFGFGGIKNLLGFAQGGVVPGPIGRPTLAVVHGGETVTPSGTTNTVAPNITINAVISSDYDVRKLADELKRYWVTDFERVSQGRSI